ncbi:MAG: hypothetical protein ACRC46_11085 [Thermoguttaceae bacterium]
MKKTILGSFAAAALVSGAVYAAPCDPCGDVAACDPCGNAAACNPCDDAASCDPCANACGPKRSKLKVYADAAAMIGNVDGGFGPLGDNVGYTMAGGVKATLGVQRGLNAVELGYTGLYNNLSTSLMPMARLYANYNAVDVNFVRTLERNKNLKVFAGFGYANFSQSVAYLPAVAYDTVANDMAGFHIGGKWGRKFTKRVGIETYGKLGVYANTVTLSNIDAVDPPSTTAFGNSRGAFVANGGINLTYQLTKRLTSFAGYDVTKIEGVERGQNNIAFGRALADDGALIQGFVFGVKAAF